MSSDQSPARIDRALPAAGRGVSLMRREEELTGWLLAAPALLLLGLFLFAPAIMALALSFTDQRLLPGPQPTQFVGMRNYLRLLEDDAFLQALRNNLYFTVVVVPLQCALALGLALLTNQKIRGANFFRTVYFSPIATTMVVVAIVWTLLFNPEGMINAFLGWISFGAIPPVRWLSETWSAMPAVMIMSIWQSVGFQMVIFLAGLQEIPESLHEAAAIDGANRWQQFIYVTIPQLRNTLVFVIVTTTILSFRLYTQVEVMTKGGPLGSTNTMVRHMIETGFGRLQTGYASAIAVVFLLIVLAVSLLQRRFITSERM
jgi:multiple sugar transport system permease protein